MGARAIASGTISFGLVAIPIKLYTAASSEQVRFNMLHEKCNGRLKMQFYCPVDDEIVERKNTVKGYEYSKGQYVRFEESELKALEAARSNSVEITEFVPLSAVDMVQVEKSYYLGPDKGGDKPYRLLSQSMVAQEVVAVGRWAARGKEQLVLIRPYGNDGLLLHQLYYSNEVRSFDEIDTGAVFDFSDIERELALKLIEQLTSKTFDTSQYHDSYEGRVHAAVEEKVAGQEITVAPEAPKAKIIDLFEALKKSLSEAQSRTANDDTVPLKPVKKTKAKSAEDTTKRVKKKKAASRG
jgi:DNA end-binding protein Ku